MAVWFLLYSTQRASFLLLSFQNSKEGSDSPKEPMKVKVVKAWAEAIKEKSTIVKDSMLWSCFLWSAFIEQRQSDGKVGTADKSRCKLREGEFKACGATKHALEAHRHIAPACWATKWASSHITCSSSNFASGSTLTILSWDTDTDVSPSWNPVWIATMPC